MSHGKSNQEVPCYILNAYKKPPSIKQIKNGFNGQNLFEKEKLFLQTFTPRKIKKLIKCLDTNKATGINTVPSKLTKIAAVF